MTQLKEVRLMQIDFYGRTFETLLKEFCPNNVFRDVAIKQAKEAIVFAKNSVKAGENKRNVNDDSRKDRNTAGES